MSTEFKRHRTAMSRTSLSRPLSLAQRYGLLNPEVSVFDYGCGRGDDLAWLKNQGIKCNGWDPAFRPNEQRKPADLVNLGFVLNVIENQSERGQVLERAWALAKAVLVVSARLTHEARDLELKPHADGFVTKSGTFQKFYEQQELQNFIDSRLNASSVTAAPGIFFIFREEQERQRFLAARVKTRVTVPKITASEILERHKEIVDPLVAFFTDRGRLPEQHELGQYSSLCEAFGSINKAFRLLLKATDPARWEEIRQKRIGDLLVFLALLRFGPQKALKELPEATRLDISSFFGRYSRAREEADKLLMSAGNLELINKACDAAPYGKNMPGALYVHKSGCDSLPPILRVYEGCARMFAGEIEDGNLIKLNKEKPQISYLVYPDFDTDAHPALLRSVVVRLYARRIDFKEFGMSPNPPILHRKETFLPHDDPNREKYAKLTKQEEKAGLFTDPNTIGQRDGWDRTLEAMGVKVVGHRLIRQKRKISPPTTPTHLAN